MNDIQKLEGQDLQDADWETAKAFAEKTEREAFERCKREGSSWMPIREALNTHRSYMRFTEKDIRREIAFSIGLGFVSIGALIGQLIAKLVA